MAGRKSKPASKGKSRSKKLSVKKRPIKDLDPTGKDVKGGRVPIIVSRPPVVVPPG